MDKTAVELFDMKVKHVGVNASGDEEAAVWAKEFLELLGLGTRDAGASYFCGELVEIMKHNGRGAKGHIAFSVNDCEASLKYFEERGFKAIEETKQYDENGTLKFFYFDREIAGFAIHLVKQA